MSDNGDGESDRSMGSYSETESDSSPPIPPTFTAENFFSKKRQRCSSTSGSSKQPEQQRSAVCSVENLRDAKRRRGQTQPSVVTQERNTSLCVTPNRHLARNTSFSTTPLAKQLRTPNNAEHESTGLSEDEIFTSSASKTVSRCDDDQCVKSALKEITSLLNTVVKRVERVENELKKQCASVSSSSDSTPSRL